MFQHMWQVYSSSLSGNVQCGVFLQSLIEGQAVKCQCRHRRDTFNVSCFHLFSVGLEHMLSSVVYDDVLPPTHTQRLTQAVLSFCCSAGIVAAGPQLITSHMEGEH